MTTYDLILAGAIGLSGLVVALLPAGLLRDLTGLFSLSNFGIRKIRRWNTTTDTLGNVLLFLSIVYCVLYPFIPYYQYIYIVLVLFAGLCALARAAIISAAQDTKYGKFELRVVVFFIWVIMLLGAAAGSGILNGQVAGAPIQAFVAKMLDNTWEFDDIFYFLTNPGLFYYLLQMALMMFPLCLLWNQFKYMRLERTYKAANLFTYCFKSILCVAILYFAGWKGFAFLNDIWHVD